MNALTYLEKKEWSLGNGQCPECCGVHVGWLGHPLSKSIEEIGHKTDCELAAAIKSVGGEPMYLAKVPA